MNFEHLKLFRDIGQSRSVSRGASLNAISQSAASQHIQELEKSLSVKLLDRSTRPLTVTPAGRLYFDLCRDILRRREEFDAALTNLAGDVEGTVRVASIYSVGLSEMWRLEAEFARRWPEAVLRVDYLRPERVYEAVGTDQADLGLVSYPEPTREVAVIDWRSEEMVVACAPGHPLTRYREIDPTELNGVEFIGFDEELPIRREVDRYFRDRDVTVNLIMHFDNLQMIKEAVMLGSGVSIAPARILQAEMEAGRLVAIPLVAPRLYRPLGIIHRRRKKFNRATQQFLSLLQEIPHGAEPE
ncbi:MAG: LysR family transcriptional regulator [Acidobacteria bacterium]|nr:LysR family transcriptional regulator [Acidobacteriota bacterium]